MAYAYCSKHNVSWDDENHEDCLECIEQIELKEQPKAALAQAEGQHHE